MVAKINSQERKVIGRKFNKRTNFKNLCTEIERHAEGNTKEKELIGTEWKEI